MLNQGKFLEELKQKCDIVSTISKFITLEKKGKTYWACCPFHHEKTPSFAVNQTEQFFHCYGCGESGDVIKFIEKYESLNFVESVKFLADSVGMKVPEFKQKSEDLEKLKLKEKVIVALQLAKNFYIECLKKESAQKARDYLKKRNLDFDIVKQFDIGFSPDWNSLVSYLDSKQIDRNVQKCAGLIDFNDSNRPYDAFGGRLMFPIKNVYGECIGFTARVLEASSTFAKYKNSTQTIVFDKSKTVYNLNSIREQKKERKIDFIIICEGTIDVIAMHKAGLKNTVACMGTAITSFHAREIKRFSDKVLICLDGDDAGQNATFKAIDVLSESGLEVKVVKLKDNLDPDEFLKNYGAEELKKAIDNPQDAIEYKILSLANKFDLKDNFEKNKYITSALDIVSKLESNSQKEIYLKIIATKVNISIDILRRDLILKTDNSQNVLKNDEIEQVLEYRENGILKAEKFVLASFVFKKDFVKDKNFDINFKNANFKKLFDWVNTGQNKNFTVSSVWTNFDIDQNKDLKEIVDFDFSKYENQEIYFKECLKKLTLYDLKEKQAELTAKFKQVSDLNSRREIANELQKIAKEIKNKLE